MNTGLRPIALVLVATLTCTLAACSRRSNHSPTGPSSPSNPTMGLSVQGIAIEGQFAINVGQQLQMAAFVTRGDGTRQDVTNEATWSTANSDIADVTKGLIVGKSAGNAVISATFENVSGRLSLTVSGQSLSPGTGDGSSGGDTNGGGNNGGGSGNDGGGSDGGGSGSGGTATVTGLSIAGSLTAGTGGSTQLTATARLSDGTQKNVTAQATWLSSNPSTASVTGGLVAGIAAGSATITARYQGAAASVTMVIQGGNGGNPPGASVVSLSVNGTLDLTLGGSSQLSVIANMSDGTHIDVTALAGYSSSNPLLASVSANGVVSGLLAGLCNITATYQGISAQAQISVKAPVSLLKITLSGATSVKLLQSIQLTATAHFSDGSTQDVTNLATWNCSNTLLGQLINGLLTALGLGDVAVSATYQGISANSLVHITLL
jgi:hypothetical protein